MSIPTPAEDPALYGNRNSQVISASATLLVLPTIFVALRVVSRFISGAGFWVCPCLIPWLILPWNQSRRRTDIYKWDDLTVVLGLVSGGARTSKACLHDKPELIVTQMFSWGPNIVIILGMKHRVCLVN